MLVERMGYDMLMKMILMSLWGQNWEENRLMTVLVCYLAVVVHLRETQRGK